jgi:hypothetical protein
MTVVGHIEQLRRSVCYQKSESLTCTTCHDPHAREQPKDKVAFYRQKCLECHATHGCSLPREERLKKEGDHCTACHMPRGDTDVPHVAFTHHRIGIHRPKTQVASDRIPELVPTTDDSRLSPIDQKRNLGLAYYKASLLAEYDRYASTFADRSKSLLEDVRADGLREGLTAQVLAQFEWKKDWDRTRTYAREALDSTDLTPESHAISLLLLASCEFEDHNYKEAIALLEQLVQLRRQAEDWRLLGVSYLLDNRPQKALDALQTALAIRPARPNIHGALYEVYRRLGDQRHAQQHLDKAHWLESNRQQ